MCSPACNCKGHVSTPFCYFLFFIVIVAVVFTSCLCPISLLLSALPCALLVIIPCVFSLVTPQFGCQVTAFCACAYVLHCSVVSSPVCSPVYLLCEPLLIWIFALDLMDFHVFGLSPVPVRLCCSFRW